METGYGRIYGTLAWPSKGKPAFALVLAEDYLGDPALQARHFRVAQEIEEDDLQKLLRRCLDMHGRHRVDRWYGNPDSPHNEFLHGFNREQAKQNRPRLYLSWAPYADDLKALSFYVHCIRDLLRHEKKLLHFGERSVLPGKLMELTLKEMDSSASDFPAVAALGYAVTALSIWKPREGPLQEYAEADYDVFS